MAHVETLIAWLNDAYAMEMALVDVLGRQARDAQELPFLHQKIVQHGERTRHHAEKVRACVESLGGEVSAAKTWFARFAGAIGTIGTRPMDDVLVKHGLADFAIENFEIACYRALIAAARAIGREDVVLVCQGILQDEEEMARWLEDELPNLVKEHMDKVAAK